MVCVWGGEGGPFYSPNRSVPTIFGYGNSGHLHGVDKRIGSAPPKLSLNRLSGCFAGPWVRPTPFWGGLSPSLHSLWAPLSTTSVPGLGWSVCSVKWTHLVSVPQDAIFYIFVLRLVFVFSLFHLWVPANQDSLKLMELVRIKPYN